MIYGKARNIVVVRKIDSDYIEQAILILKKEPDQREYYASGDGIVREAERIIEQYGTAAQKEEKIRTLPVILFLVIISAAVTLLWICH